MKNYKLWYSLDIIFITLFFLSTLTNPSLIMLLLSLASFILCGKYYKE